MLIIENDSVYEIDEECLKKRKVPKECGVYEKIVKEEAAKNPISKDKVTKEELEKEERDKPK